MNDNKNIDLNTLYSTVKHSLKLRDIISSTSITINFDCDILTFQKVIDKLIKK